MKPMKIIIWFMVSFVSICTNAYPLTFESTPFIGSTLIRSNDTEKHTMILMLHGSEGGSRRSLAGEANLLASMGYGVMTYCYFDCNRGLTGPRQTLQDVELTQVQAAMSWLRQHSASNNKVVVYGFSRGAELSMILGSLSSTRENRPSAIIAHSPSDVYNGAYNWDWNEPACWICILGEGQCTKDSKETEYRWNPSCNPKNDINKMDFTQSAWRLNGVNISTGTPIAIEKYDGPIMITVGTKDTVWPFEQTQRLEERLKKSGRVPEVIYFSNADHGFYGADEMRRRDLVLDFLSRVP
jgi:dienelactone hydrolase